MEDKKTHFYSYQITTEHGTDFGNGTGNINSFKDVESIEEAIMNKFSNKGLRYVSVSIISIHKF